MRDLPVDEPARARFRTEWDRNFAVSANAGSGKTTAISERLAAMACAVDAAERLRRTAVVTYTRKAAAQIGQRARQVLLGRLSSAEARDLAPLDHLEKVFFGTIHSFCLKLAQTYGQTLGVNLNPAVVAEDDGPYWEEFLEQDDMKFESLVPAAMDAFLRHVPLESIFPLARELDAATAVRLKAQAPRTIVPQPFGSALEQLLAIIPKGSGRENTQVSRRRAQSWQAAWERQERYLPLYEPAGSTKAVVEAATAWMAPLKQWLADAAASLSGELAMRYRAWRLDRGVQTYADQVDAAVAVLGDADLLDRIRRENWRIILDEAQDTDPQQFAVLVEITRPIGVAVGAWPGRMPDAIPPRAGHFCMVGDGQQSIYGSRADIGNFSRHVDAFRRGEGGELLEFHVTFRAPRALIDVLNRSLPTAFGPDLPHNFGPPARDGALAPLLQVPYVALAPGPANVRGAVLRVPLVAPTEPPRTVQAWLAEESRQVAAWLRQQAPDSLGIAKWGDVTILAPRNDWLLVARKELERAGFEVALQTRRHRSGDNPAFAWLVGLLAVCADPDNLFEWTGVLREVFAISDAVLAAEVRLRGRFMWEEPGSHPPSLAEALAAVRPFVLQANDPGRPLGNFVHDLATTCALAWKAAAVDPSGGVAGELDRLLALAAVAGHEGRSPREWLDELLAEIDQGRPAGKPGPGAINLLTSHSAKGLEWPVVILLGVWRGIGHAPERGMKLVHDVAGPRVFFDAASLPLETRDARERERIRELTRLLYVSVTRPQRTLVVPWARDFGGRQSERPSFAELWAASFDELPDLGPTKTEVSKSAILRPPSASPEPPGTPAASAVPYALPKRLLPHQLSQDLSRDARHEDERDARSAILAGDEAIDYGLWWHETMEFLPWAGTDAAVADYGRTALEKARSQGFAARAEDEWRRLLGSQPYRELRHERWNRLAELAIFAPLGQRGWIDGVMDFVLHDAAAGDLWIVDWKTNRPRAQEQPSRTLSRLADEYRLQLQAYGECAKTFFPSHRIRVWLYASAIGGWVEVAVSRAPSTP